MAYEMRISDWSSDVCSSDLQFALRRPLFHIHPERIDATGPSARACCLKDRELCATRGRQLRARFSDPRGGNFQIVILLQGPVGPKLRFRSEEHTSELQSLMRSSYAVFCLKKKIISHAQHHNTNKNTQ